RLSRCCVRLDAGRRSFVRPCVEEVYRHLAGQHFPTLVRQSVKLAEAASHGVPISQYSKRSAGFEDYQALANEILQQEAAMATAEEVRIATAPAVTPDGVTFTIEAPAAAHVPLAGDLNDCMADGTGMEAVGR